MKTKRTTKKINVRKIFRDINKRLKENKQIILVEGKQRGMSVQAIDIGKMIGFKK